jgi:multicomponent Na+:H+ antiporter subunit A
VIGDLHLVTSLFFDIGVYLVVVGLVLDILRSLGAEIDRRAETGEDPVSVDAAGGSTEVDRDVPAQVRAGSKPAGWGGGVP